MRALLVLAVVILLMALAGWVRFYSSQEDAGVEFDTQEMREDIDHAGDTLERAVEDVNHPNDEVETPPDPLPEDDYRAPTEVPPRDPSSPRSSEPNEFD